MNTLNAVGFLALGSMMNALPALMPSMVERGGSFSEMTPSALWLHLMGLVVGLIGGSWMMREIVAYHTALRAASARVAVPVSQTRFASGNTSSAQTA